MSDGINDLKRNTGAALDPERRLRAFCPRCGLNPSVDEEGCCDHCGSDAVGDGVDALSWFQSRSCTMADQSRGGISYCDRTWNVTLGCSPVSAGCAACWAKGMVRRIESAQHSDNPTVTVTVQWNGEICVRPDWLAKPLHWRKPRVVLVQTLGDLFHERVPFEFIAATYGVMAACPQHTFLVLTKRPERMLEFHRWVEKRGDDGKSIFPYDNLPWRIGQFFAVSAGRSGVRFGKADPRSAHWPLPNVLAGISAENQAELEKRWSVLRQVPSARYWWSLEPLLGPCDFLGDVDGGVPPDFVAVGPETGPRARPCDVEWIRSVVRQCRDVRVPVHVKAVPIYPQVGHAPPRASSDTREWPDDLRVQDEVPYG